MSIRFAVTLASSSVVHLTEVELYSRNVKNAFTFRMRWYSCRGGGGWIKQQLLVGSQGRSDQQGVHLSGVFKKRGFIVTWFSNFLLTLNRTMNLIQKKISKTKSFSQIRRSKKSEKSLSWIHYDRFGEKSSKQGFVADYTDILEWTNYLMFIYL